MLNGLDLFSGIAGLTIALQDWIRPIAYCESDRYCQAVLLSRMAEEKIPCAPIWDDVRTLSKRNFDTREEIDIITAGFPCQDISVAGLGKGLAGERSGLFWEILRLAKEIKPKFIFLENVPAIRLRGLNTIGEELASIGYDCRWDIVSAAEVGAPHLRKRWFFLAHARGDDGVWQQRRRGRASGEIQTELGDNGQEKSLADTQGIGSRPRTPQFYRSGQQDHFMRKGWWETEPAVRRVVDGFPHRVDQIKCLGNAVVPLQARTALMRLMGL